MAGGSQGSDPREYGKQYEVKLRKAELESIEDYIAESKNLTILHEQVGGTTAASDVQLGLRRGVHVQATIHIATCVCTQSLFPRCQA